MAIRMRRRGVVAGVFRQVNTCCHAERNKNTRAEHQPKRADNGGHNATGTHAVARHGGEEFP